MTTTDIQIAICGSAGDGTIAAGGILNQAMARAGYKVIAFDVYPAEIRGFGECIARSRITSDQVYSLKTRSDILVSLNDGHAIAHVPEVRQYGAVIYDDAPMAALKEGPAHLGPHQGRASCPTACRCARSRSARPAPPSRATWWRWASSPGSTRCRATPSTRPSRRSSRARLRPSPRATSRPSMPATRKGRGPSSTISSRSARPACPSPAR